MTESTPLTKAQRQKFYREAVQETLISIYEKPESESKQLVIAWWKRASEAGDLGSELFFHAEPLHVAADISHMPSIEITAKNEKAYRAVLRRAREQAVAKSGPSRREIMDIHQAADYLGISPDTLYKYATEGFMPAFKLGNRWRFKRSRLDEWIVQQPDHTKAEAGLNPIPGGRLRRDVSVKSA